MYSDKVRYLLSVLRVIFIGRQNSHTWKKSIEPYKTNQSIFNKGQYTKSWNDIKFSLCVACINQSIHIHHTESTSNNSLVENMFQNLQYSNRAIQMTNEQLNESLTYFLKRQWKLKSQFIYTSIKKINRKF